MVLFQQVDLCTGVNIQIIYCGKLDDLTHILLHAVDFQGCFN